MAEQLEGNVTIIKKCISCNTITTITVTASQHYRWQHGELIQRVMPELSEDDRELLISGMCGNCFDNLFNEKGEPK